MFENSTFGDWLRQRRKALDLTQAELADQVGCSTVTIRKIEANERRPSKQISERMADVLAISSEERRAFLAFARRLANRSAPPLPGDSLPRHSTTFVGREDELQMLADLLTDPGIRLLTILATGGMGKTRIALEAARRQIGQQPDGVFFVPLAPLSAANDIVGAIAECIGYHFYGQETPAQQLISFLQDRSMLLVLDNFEHLLDGAPFVARILEAAAKVKVLVTSRERLNLHSETVYTLRGFMPPVIETLTEALESDAVTLFSQGARRVRPDFVIRSGDLKALGSICYLTAGMPLGIELAAGWVDMLSLDQIVTELHQGLDILETDMRDVPERQRSLRTTFERSWEHLSAEEQRVFMYLTVFRGGFTVESARAVATAELSSLRNLAHKALLQVGQDYRYEIHELLRQFGAEKLAATDKLAAVRARHSDFFSDFMEARKADIKVDRQLEALALIDPDFENVRVAWLYMIECRDWDKLPKFLHSFCFYLNVRTRGHLGVELLEQALSVIDTMPLTPQVELARGRVLARLGWFYHDIGAADKASAAFKEAFRILRQYDSPEDLLAALHGRQNVHRLDQVPEAWEASHEGLSLARKIGDKYWEAHLLSFAGLLGDVEKDFVTASRLSEEALAAFQQIGDRWGLMVTYIALGRIKLNLKIYDAARHWFGLVQPLAEAFDHTWTQINLYNFYATISHNEQDLDSARRELCEALKLVWNTGYRWLTPGMLLRFARLFADEGDLGPAIEILGTLQKHPLSFAETDQKIQAMCDELEPRLEAEVFASALARGQERELNALVAEILASYGEERQLQVAQSG